MHRDLGLVRAALDGDRQAASQLAKESYTFVFDALLRLCGGNQDLAADLTQETFRIAWASLASFRGRSRFTTWLYRIAYNAFLQNRQKSARVVALVPSIADGLRDPRTPADSRLDRLETAQRLRRQVLTLPDRESFVIAARYWAGLSTREIANAEGVGEAAIRKRLRKAIRSLKRSWSGRRS